MFAGKKLLITGGTGTFGNAVLCRFLDTDISEIRVFSRDENKQDDMRHVYPNAKLRFYIGDVRNESSLRDAMTGVDFVFQAAALSRCRPVNFSRWKRSGPTHWALKICSMPPSGTGSEKSIFSWTKRCLRRFT
jgi:nucleoside-diphosphate-sugar epimerase